MNLEPENKLEVEHEHDVDSGHGDEMAEQLEAFVNAAHSVDANALGSLIRGFWKPSVDTSEKFAVVRQIEEGQILCAPIRLQLRANRPDMLRSKRRF